ncbi:MAG: hypothetical protein M3257_02275, partial [Actinomycetota bacterium]|nr:hypothetical protein [Actinomycetota bacterium]
MTAPDPATLLQEGLERHARGDLDAAERLYRQVLRLRPKGGALEGNAQNLLGVLARQRGDPAEALLRTERALA